LSTKQKKQLDSKTHKSDKRMEVLERIILQFTPPKELSTEPDTHDGGKKSYTADEDRTYVRFERGDKHKDSSNDFIDNIKV